VKKAREKKEAAKRRELNKKRIKELTQGAAESREMERKKLEVIHKDVMKKNKPDASKRKKKKGGKTTGKETEKSKDTNEIIPANPVAGPGKEKGRKETKVPEAAQGKRKAPEAGDQHGCNHHGLLELLPLPKAYLEAYVKEGGWLYKKPCKDCAGKEREEKEQVLDVSTLLGLKGRKDVGYYCNSGPAGHRMGDEAEWRHQWTCDMVLCLDCYARRLTSMGSSKRTRRRNQSL
jgi:hypothetical protein